MTHYLDNSATTPLCDAAREKMTSVMNGIYGNPSSLHAIGAEAQAVVDEARRTIIPAFLPAGTRGAPEQLIFTSGGTEANNLALIGTATAKARNAGRTVIVGETEHASVISCADHLSSLGYKVIYIPSPNGVWDMEKYLAALSGDVILVSAMLVNNETGAVNDIARIAEAARRANPDVTVHCDAVQGFLRLPQKLYSAADLVSVSAHKIGGPKGTGALFVGASAVKKRTLSPVIFGGGQEHGMRSGTENVIGIAGFGAAAGYFRTHGSEIAGRLSELRRYAGERLSGLAPLGVRVNAPETERVADHIISVTASGVRSETMLHFLSSRGVFVSSGSACASNTKAKSHVLKSFGLSDIDADSTVRISFGADTSKEDIDAACEAISDGMKTLQKRG